MMKMIWNLNNSVLVELTEIGLAHHKKRHEAFWNFYGRPDLAAKYEPPKPQPCGRYRFQMHDFMEKFGDSLDAGNQRNPFSMHVLIEVQEKSLFEMMLAYGYKKIFATHSPRRFWDIHHLLDRIIKIGQPQEKVYEVYAKEIGTIEMQKHLRKEENGN